MSVEFTGIADDDRDLLADFAAGVLSDREATKVAHLIRTAPGWRQAYTELVTASDSIAATLRDLGQEPEPMPADVSASIHLRLRAAVGPALSGPASSGERLPSGTPVPRSRRRTGVVGPPGSDAPISTRPPNQQSPTRRRRRRFLAGLTGVTAAFIAVVAAVGVFSDFRRNMTATGDAAIPAQGDNGAKGGGMPELSAGTPLYSVSQRDYRLDTLPTAASLFLGPAPHPSRAGASVDAVESADRLPQLRGQVASDLVRLTDPSALQQCLGSISVIHPGTPVLFEFARFNGSPALIVVIRASAGGTVLAVGPQCGAGGPDELAAAPA